MLWVKKMKRLEDIVYELNGRTEVRLHFIVANKFKRYHVGKSWPKHTQCLMYENGLLSHFETVIKHSNDEDNPAFAYKLVAEKCLKHIPDKWLRSQVRIKLNEEIKEL